MTTKRCCRCRQHLPLGDFSKHPKSGLQPMCRACNRQYQREHYLRNKADYLAKARSWAAIRQRQNLERILAYFEEHPCVDCGESDPLVLHFDHMRGEKVTEVSTLYLSGSSWSRILAEVEKCDVRCARCHVRRHAADSGWRRLRLSLAADAEPVPIAELPAPVKPDSPGRARPLTEIIKQCRTCGLDLPFTDFAVHRDGRQSRCKACQRAYSRAHYLRNRAKYIARIRTRNLAFHEANMARVVAYLRDHPCVDCGETDPVVLQFDHVRGVKRANVGQLVRNAVLWERVEAEIRKCEVRCINCHTRRTASVIASRMSGMLMRERAAAGYL